MKIEPVRILIGDVMDGLAKLPDGSVHCCCTSPPYWGLRDYGVDGQLGLESTPEAYVEKMVAVFREVRRVLREDATLWLNLGDSYNGIGGPGKQDGGPIGVTAAEAVVGTRGRRVMGLKPKDLCGIPWRVVLALQADGWYWRSCIVWAKKSPMPESVTDRPTSSWEPIFLMSKSERYFYDAEAVREALNADTVSKIRQCMATPPDKTQYKQNAAVAHIGGGSTVSPNAAWRDAEKLERMLSGRNQRNVWHLGPEPYAEAHFATFPTEIPRRAIKAGTSEKGCCPACGAPWRRLVESKRVPTRSGRSSKVYVDPANSPYEQHSGSIVGNRDPFRHCTESRTTGWEPTCDCDGIDRRLIHSPTGERAGEDPSLSTGRAGMNRPRGDDEGTAPMTRHEQAEYAEQLRRSPHRAAMATASGSSFAHYIRTDESGARPIPRHLLETWIACGWLNRVAVPVSSPLSPIPCTVLDPFLGSGTTVAVARQLGRYGVGCELNPEYAELARERIGKAEKPLTFQSNRVVDSPLFTET